MRACKQMRAFILKGSKIAQCQMSSIKPTPAVRAHQIALSPMFFLGPRTLNGRVSPLFFLGPFFSTNPRTLQSRTLDFQAYVFSIQITTPSVVPVGAMCLCVFLCVSQWSEVWVIEVLFGAGVGRWGGVGLFLIYQDPRTRGFY